MSTDVHVVLVHGAGGSSATWSSVAPLLRGRGRSVVLVDLPMESLRGDERAVRDLVDGLDGAVLLVGHSYGGAVITNAGTHERVVGLVYVAAFAPDRGETVSGIVGAHEPAPVARFMRRGPDGEWVGRDDEEARLALAWDVPADVWAAGKDFGRPTADAAFQQSTGDPAWTTRPSWYVVATEDATLLPAIQRHFVERSGAEATEVATSHAVAHAAPERVVEVVEQALVAVAGAD